MTNATEIKILYIGMIPPEVGGLEAGGIATHVWELAREAHKRGYGVHILANTTSSFTKYGLNVIAPPQKSEIVKWFHVVKQYIKIDKKHLNSLRVLNLKERIGALYQAYYLQQILESVKPDLIHVHSFLNSAPLSLSVFKNCPPIVITDHGIGTIFEYGLQKLFKIKNRNYLLKTINERAKSVNYIITVSAFENDHLKKNFYLPKTLKTKTIPNPLDIRKTPFLDKVKIKKEVGWEDKRVIFFLGGLHAIKKKGLGILLKAFDINDYLRMKCKLLVVTNGEAVSFARDFVKEKKIDGLITGHQSWEKLVRYYNIADVFVMPSQNESFGITYTEALLAGTPVVGFHESIKELENLLGIYIGEKFDTRKEDEKMLAEKIIKVLNTEFDRKLLRKKVIEELSWDAKFGEFESIYEEVLRE